MDHTELAVTPQPATHCRDCRAELPAGTLACPQCATLVYGRHVEQISKAARNLEDSNQPNHLAEARDLWLSALPWLPRASQQAGWIHQRVLALDTRINAVNTPPSTPSKWAKRLGPLAPILVVLAKFKTAFLFLFKLKFIFSFLAFFGVYWALYGVWFGAGFAVSILIHEMGHFVAVKRRGFKAELPIFLPGFGAFVTWQGLNVSLATRAEIALAGPFAGLLAAAACMGLYVTTQRPVFAALAHAGAWINLLNLIPIWILDGEKATHALSRLQRLLLLAACIVFYILTGQIAFLLVAAGMVYRLFTHDLPAEPDTRTMIYFITLLFLLGALLKIVPNQPR